MPTHAAHAAPEQPARHSGAGGLPRRRALLVLGAPALALAAAGCATRRPDTDGLPDAVPRNLERTPDAVPRVETIREGGPNKPYEVGGRLYVPFTADRPHREVGSASWYGRRYHGRPTSLGEPYDMFAMTAAHPTLPLPSYARVRNPANGRVVIVRVNDRGPFVPGRIVDLSYTAALRLDVHRGVSTVELERLTFEQIRSGAWRRG
ncbi:MAG: septal ring lytic transglycosylase RlpA family protein, partial [Rubrivivax sp.]